VFLDIEMPDGSGLSLTRELRSSRLPGDSPAPKVVFVTAYEQHAVEAFEVDAVDYVLKPVGADRLAQAVRRVVAELPVITAPVAADAEAQRELTRRVPVEVNGRTIFVDREDVHVVEASRDYVKLHTSTKSHLVRMPISTLEQVWSSLGFLRVHRSYLVSVEKVRELRTDDGGTTIIVGNLEVPVSRTYARDLKQRLLKGR
jgi:two-component system, LytTR family, response regulator LytT